MAIIKCKMCGGDMELSADKTFGTCEYCGSTMTLPKVSDEQRAAAFNRGNHFRRTGEFDKALAVYERIVREDDTDAEAHWCCALCRFGIEYVEDPATYEYMPTCHRASFDSFLEDVDYLAAVEHSDGITRRQYQKDAAKIAEVQRGILATSQNEEPFDVFICYKETDENGRRTKDSTLAQDIYYQLTEQGRRVFFARITLEDKGGAEYEPYIFAALNSAKVMIAVGTKPEHFNAVWVKNEWSRFLSLMKKDHSKLLLPCYRDMDPYDLPEALSVLQSYDMSKIGFIQDLIRGVNKVLDAAAPKAIVKETVVVNNTVNTNTAPLLKRAFMYLEDGDWQSADEYCERVLDQDPENAEAYLGKLMAELHCSRKERLKDEQQAFSNKNNYQKAFRFGSNGLKTELESANSHILNRNETARKERIYQDACSRMASENEANCKKAAELFASVSGYKNAEDLAQKALDKAEEIRQEGIYQQAQKHREAYTVLDCKKASELFTAIPGYKDADRMAALCLEDAEMARKDAILSAAKSKMTRTVISNYESAIKLFESISGWKDADEQIYNCKKKIEEFKAKAEADRLERERKAEIARVEAEKRAKRNKKIAIITTPIICAVIAFVIILNTVIIPNSKYNDAVALMNEGKIVEAYEALIALDGYKDSAEKASSIYDEYIIEKIKVAEVGDYVFFGAYEQDNNTTNGKEDIEWLVLDKKDGKALVISKYALDCQQYNTSYTDVTWETCSLRKWLNGTFINAAFTDAEKSLIPTVTVSADKNPEYSTNLGNATQDKVFLLSITEVNKYFSSDIARQCKATAYAEAQGALVSDSNGNCWWWLRSPGFSQDFAAYVRSGGDVREFGGDVDYSNRAVRPALWIDISNES